MNYELWIIIMNYSACDTDNGCSTARSDWCAQIHWHDFAFYDPVM